MSDSSRKMGVVELAVPSEERIELSRELNSVQQQEGNKNRWAVKSGQWKLDAKDFLHLQWHYF